MFGRFANATKYCFFAVLSGVANSVNIEAKAVLPVPSDVVRGAALAAGFCLPVMVEP